MDVDILVVGSGVAGLTAAIHGTRSGLRVGLVTKGRLTQSATRWAQGGVAAVLGADEDSTDLHLADTLEAGGELCDGDAVRLLVEEGPARVHELIAMGAQFDRDDRGNFDLAREGGHSRARVVHAGGAATGEEIERALVETVRSSAAALWENVFATELLVEGGRCVGVSVLGQDGKQRPVRSRHVVMATGGAGQLYAVTTNPPEATGDGLAMALRARVAVADIEFVQFHPTALHHPAMPRPLLSEALRGHGALIRDAKGERFLDELAPRDVVSRAIAARMLEQNVDNMWLDATGLNDFERRFPTIATSLSAAGLDPASDWLPIAPAAHYVAGGVITDLSGATTMPGLWACGEVACTGVHGANRLASNSLLEGMVFAPRVIEAIADGRTECEPTGVMRALMGREAEVGARVLGPVTPIPIGSGESGTDVTKATDQFQRAMTRGAGVLRSEESLERTFRLIEEIASGIPVPATADQLGLANLMIIASALLRSARIREESRGSHTRIDFPETSSKYRERLVIA